MDGTGNHLTCGWPAHDQSDGPCGEPAILVVRVWTNALPLVSYDGPLRDGALALCPRHQMSVETP